MRPLPSPLPARAVVLLGLPWDAMSSHMRGPSEAPAKIRAALECGSANLCDEQGRDLAVEERFVDAGDLSLSDDAGALESIASEAGSWLARGARLLGLGGDHAVTLGLLRAYARRFPDLSVLHLDAHPDLYDAYDGNRYSHACPFARAMEEGLVRRLVQVGIRTMNPAQAEQARRFGVEVVSAAELGPKQRFEFDGPLYISVDLDALDPAYAPGVSHHEPGGLSTRRVLQLIQQTRGEVVGADVVELNPKRDVNEMTAMVAAKLTRELAGRLVADSAV